MPRRTASPPLIALGFALVVRTAAAGPEPVEAPSVPQLESSERAAARTLAYDGVVAYEEGRYDDAIAALDRAFAIVHVQTIRLWSARALVKKGRWTEAAERYLEIARMPILEGNAAVQRQAREAAIAERAALMPKIPKLRVDLEKTPPIGRAARGSKSPREVRIDGAPLAPALVGVFVMLDPGDHEIEVHGREARRMKFHLDEAEIRTMSFDVAPLPDTALETTWTPALAEQRSIRLKSAVALAALGGAGLVVGASAGVYAIERWSAAKTACPGLSFCRSDAGHDDAVAARSAGAISTVGFAVGVSSVVGSTILFTTAAPRPADAGRSAMVRMAPFAIVGEF